MILTAISPRFAIRTFGFFVTVVSCLPDALAPEAPVLTRDDLLQALAAIRVTAPVRAEEVTASTNATAAAMAADGAPVWTLVSASHQTHGRGRLDRVWEDVPGRALMFSLVLRPDLPATRVGLLSLLAGASMAEAIREVTGRRVTCDWPNDLYLDGRKVGGVLAESSVRDGQIEHVVIGLGVNLEPPPGVAEAGGVGDCSMRELLVAFLVRMAASYEAAEPTLPERVRAAWMPVAGTMGQLVRATGTEGHEIVGRAVGIDDFGSLRLSTDEGEALVSFGDVHHVVEDE